MAFTASTTRRVLYEDNSAGFLYPIGNTPAKAVLAAGQRLPASCKVLLLGCGDVRNALTTAAALHTAGCSSAEIHLNDISDVILARDAILLAAATTVDCSNPDDLAFIWGIWFNAQLEQDQRQRLDILLQQVIEGQLPPTITLANDNGSDDKEGLLHRLSNIWRSWLNCRTSPQCLAAERKSFMLSAINRRQRGDAAVKRSWDAAAKLASSPELLDERVLHAKQLPQDIKSGIAAELQEYFFHGSVQANGMSCTGTAINPTLLNQRCQWRVHDSACPFDCFPTITQKQLMIGSSTSSSEGGAGRGAGGGGRGSCSARQPAGPGMLTRAAQGLLGQMIAAYQAAASNGSYGLDSSSGGIRFVLHGGDGLQLCSSVSSSLRDTLFDAIDASNMGDHVGLLNLLVAVGPRLLPKAHARLTVDTMTWSSSKAKSITEYLCMALGGPPSLLPSLLGLRLCTETRFGRLEPYSLGDRLATRSSNTRMLEFAPAVPCASSALADTSDSSQSQGKANDIGPETQSDVNPEAPSITFPLRPEGSSKGATQTTRDLAAALLALQHMCCASLLGYYVYDSSSLMLHTPATLARLVVNMVLTGRVVLQMQPALAAASGGPPQAVLIDGSSSSGGSVWDQLERIPEVWPLEPQFQHAWTAAWQQVLLDRHTQSQDTILPAATLTNGNSENGSQVDDQGPQYHHQQQQKQHGQQQKQQQQQQIPVVLTGTMQPLAMHNTPTPLVRLLLISDAAAEALKGAFSSKGSRNFPTMLQQLLPFACPAAVVVCEALQNGKGLPAAAGGGGVAVIDQLVIDCDMEEPGKQPMQVSFLLPGVHHFDPNTTTVCLVQHQTGTLHCTPHRLSTFKQQQLDTPMSLLLPMKQATGVERAPASSSSSSGGSRTAAISLVELKETATEYTAILRVSGDESCSGLSATPTEMVKPVGVMGPSVTHEVTLSVSQPAGTRPFKLRLLHPIESNTASYKFSRAARTITARLLKSSDSDWPCDIIKPANPTTTTTSSSSRCSTAASGRRSKSAAGINTVSCTGGGVFCRFDAEKDLDETSALDIDGTAMFEMFDHAEAVEQLLTQGNTELGHPFKDLRETIKILFIRAVKEKVFMHKIIDKEEPESSDVSHTMFIRVHTPLRRQPNGRPLMVLTVVDNVLGLKLRSDGKVDMKKEIKRFQEVIMRPNAGQCSTTFCSKAELKLLRALLARNSRRMIPTTWQAKNLPLDSTDTHWLASFIAPVYPEVLGDSQKFFDAIPDMSALPGFLRGPAARAAAGMQRETSSSTTATATSSRTCRPSAAAGALSRAQGAAPTPQLRTSVGAPRDSASFKAASAPAGAAGSEPECCRVCGVVKGKGAGEVTKLVRCSKCKNLADRYCSSACQKADWPRHKKTCRAS